METTTEIVRPATELTRPVATTPTVEPQSVVPLSRIKVKPGHNPRGFFDPEAHAELVALISEQGVLQPILVRPIGDGSYWIVAGERRYRAAMEARGEDFQMPVLIRQMTDEEADIFAMVENTKRQNMSPTEEAVQANKVLVRCKGDRDEAARLLGWSRSTLDKRLALLACTPEVRSALDKRDIDLGHAELLAGLARDKQAIFLKTIIEQKLKIADVKKAIEAAACKLEKAIFDKTDCMACPHNSSLQKSMFAESIAEGCCTNRQCYSEKKEAKIQSIKANLADEYQTIRIFRPGDNGTSVPLEAEGQRGVGSAQFEQCHACANYGVAILDLPEREGHVSKGQCFDLSCNSKKVGARIKAEQEAEAAKKAPPATASQPGTAAAGKGDAKADAKAKPEKEVTSVTVNDRIKAYREAVWRKAMATEIRDNPHLSPQYLIAMCLNGSSRHISDTKLKNYFAQLKGECASFHDLGEVAGAVANAAPETQTRMLVLLAVSAMEGLDVQKLQQLATYHELDMTKHWKLDQAFLDLMTKAEIRVIAREAKLDESFGAEFAKLFGEKKPDLIKKLLSVEGFDYSATVPAILKY